MEVCGTHTSAIVKSGLRNIISTKIRLVSGPGCPVCVTPPSYIDDLCDISKLENTTVCTFGDMMKVRGNRSSLYEARAAGADVRMVYAPMDILKWAKAEPDRKFVMAAVGFETTHPVYALLLQNAIEDKIANVYILASLKKIIPALEYICRANFAAIDGFIAPGHVSAVIGANAYSDICTTFGKPLTVTGFSAEEILVSIYDLVNAIIRKKPEVHNLYCGVVRDAGNPDANNLIDKYFEVVESDWRAIESIPDSGIQLKQEWSRFDAYKVFDIKNKNNAPSLYDIKQVSKCRCKEVIMGQFIPTECALFAGKCTPENPIGPCMVSEEGSCGIYFQEGIRRA
jgi:hydrogenase expression/formation protein HypD